MSPELVAERYFTAMRERDLDALAGLYADDAEFILPDGRVFNGRIAILALHDSVFQAGAPVPAVLGMVVGPDSIAVEIEARLGDGSTRRTANFYRLDFRGKIVRLSVYTKTG